MRRIQNLLAASLLLVFAGFGCSGQRAASNGGSAAHPLPPGSIFTSQEYGFSIMVSDSCGDYYSVVSSKPDFPPGALELIEVKAKGYGTAFSYTVMPVGVYGQLSDDESAEPAARGAMPEEMPFDGVLGGRSPSAKPQIVRTLDGGLYLTSRGLQGSPDAPDGCSLRIE